MRLVISAAPWAALLATVSFLCRPTGGLGWAVILAWCIRCVRCPQIWRESKKDPGRVGSWCQYDLHGFLRQIIFPPNY